MSPNALNIILEPVLWYFCFNAFLIYLSVEPKNPSPKLERGFAKIFAIGPTPEPHVQVPNEK